ncbi:phytoene desaturase family protein [Sphingomonas solaris]|uniref:Pyridine nucleotide-disulfide oxidoreductase domain-containing protein 2 n=1 Tax=Alterirhizorhabdus solaris TaxID=2529389 RepID=A0A558RCT6_9SPHN|nr:NAD(P)/FAD-dependent oxidoreductase [Sphingomonas solaris]TVV77140.1 NAD(P)/FAD-dependent oxidoreductase [Sphingomonas solaris]
MIEEADVVIVGAGHNGMAAAGYLSRAGKRVVVVERLGKVGGMTSAGYMIPEAPEHLVTPCAVELLFVRGTGLIEDLELEKHGLRWTDPDPTYAYLDPDGSSICLFRDPQRTADDMARLNRNDGNNYLKFLKLLDALMDIGFPLMQAEPGRPEAGNLVRMIGSAVRNVKLKNELQIMAAGTADQIACEWFEHPASIALLTNTAAGAGPIDDDGNAAAYMILAVLHRLGTGKPIGSLQAFADAMARSVTASGADIRLNAPVAEILIEDGAARGVRLEDGRIIKAKAVIASCDPRTAFAMTTPGRVERRLLKRIEHAPANRSNAAPFLANIAMSKPLTLRRHQDLRHDGADLNKAVGYIGTPEEVRESFAAARRGDIPKRHALSVTPLSNSDPTQAPAGGSLAYVYVPAMAVDAREGWSPALKDRTVADLKAQMSEFYDGFDSEVGRFVETPRDREKRLNVTNGCVTHIDFGSLRSGQNRPATGFGGPKPAVPGLYVGGAGAHPGGGISGIPGRIAAKRVLRQFRTAK